MEAVAPPVRPARWILAFGLAVGMFAAAAPTADVLGWAALAVTGAIIGAIALANPAIREPLLAAFLLRAAAAVVQNYVVMLPGSELDAVGFERTGAEWAQDGMAGAMSRFTSGAYLYSWIIAVLYVATGRSALMIQTLNVFFGTLVVWNAFALAKLAWGVDAARRTAWITALFPTLVLFSAITLREVAVGYPLTLGVLFFARWRTRNRPGWLLAAMAAFACAIAFHTAVIGMIAAALFIVVLNWLRSLLQGRVVASGKVLVGLVVAGAVATVIFSQGWGGIDWERTVTREAVQYQQEVSSQDRAAYLTGMVTSGPADLLWHGPVRTIYFLFMPFPWIVRTPADVIGLVDAVLYLWLFWHISRNLRRVWANDAARSAFVLSMSAIVVFALVVSNYGTAIRHRAKVAPLLAAVASVGMVAAPSRVRKREPGADAAPSPPALAL